MLFFLCLCFGFHVMSQEIDSRKIKYRKLSHSDFIDQFGINDTATVAIDIFFDKKENSAYGQMTFLPITVGLAIIPDTRVIGVGTTLISLPLFLNGCYMLIKYRKRKLHKVLTVYTNTKELPKWLQKKVDKHLLLYKVMDREY